MARLFFAFPIPPVIQVELRSRLTNDIFSSSRILPPENWHIRLAYLGEQKLTSRQLNAVLTPAPQPFFPVVCISHIGAGQNAGQVWAYVRPTKSLLQLQSDLTLRLGNHQITFDAQRAFLPHVHLAHSPSGAMSNQAVSLTFPASDIAFYESTGENTARRYTIRGTISLRN